MSANRLDIESAECYLDHGIHDYVVDCVAHVTQWGIGKWDP